MFKVNRITMPRVRRKFKSISIRATVSMNLLQANIENLLFQLISDIAMIYPKLEVSNPKLTWLRFLYISKIMDKKNEHKFFGGQIKCLPTLYSVCSMHNIFESVNIDMTTILELHHQENGQGKENTSPKFWKQSTICSTDH